jgi:hypothetical protein
VAVGRLVTVLLMIVAAALTFVLDSARATFELLMSVGAGTGLIYLLRWFWWRVNAWSEIAAMISSFTVAVGLFVAGKMGADLPNYISLPLSVGVTSVVWITVTLLTKPVDWATLVSFCRLVQPAGPGWRDVRERAGIAASSDSLPSSLLAWVLGCAFVYSALFGVGEFLYGRMSAAAIFFIVFTVTGVTLGRMLPRLWGRAA